MGTLTWLSSKVRYSRLLWCLCRLAYSASHISFEGSHLFLFLEAITSLVLQLTNPKRDDSNHRDRKIRVDVDSDYTMIFFSFWRHK